MYFTIQIRHKTDGTYSNNVYTYETENEALKKFYSFFSTYLLDDVSDYLACIIMREGLLLKSDIVDNRDNNIGVIPEEIEE